jgi:hypothetical protein
MLQKQAVRDSIHREGRERWGGMAVIGNATYIYNCTHPGSCELNVKKQSKSCELIVQQLICLLFVGFLKCATHEQWKKIRSTIMILYGIVMSVVDLVFLNVGF